MSRTAELAPSAATSRRHSQAHESSAATSISTRARSGARSTSTIRPGQMTSTLASVASRACSTRPSTRLITTWPSASTPCPAASICENPKRPWSDTWMREIGVVVSEISAQRPIASNMRCVLRASAVERSSKLGCASCRRGTASTTATDNPSGASAMARLVPIMPPPAITISYCLLRPALMYFASAPRFPRAFSAGPCSAHPAPAR